MLRQTAKKSKRYISDSTGLSYIMFKVYGTTIQKRLNKHGFTEALFSLKRALQQSLVLHLNEPQDSWKYLLWTEKTKVHSTTFKEN